VADITRQALGAGYIYGKQNTLYSFDNQRHLVRNVTRPAGHDIVGVRE